MLRNFLWSDVLSVVLKRVGRCFVHLHIATKRSIFVILRCSFWWQDSPQKNVCEGREIERMGEGGERVGEGGGGRNLRNQIQTDPKECRENVLSKMKQRDLMHFMSSSSMFFLCPFLLSSAWKQFYLRVVKWLIEHLMSSLQTSFTYNV